jgi:DNA-binding IclR family transcriptional regulator
VARSSAGTSSLARAVQVLDSFDAGTRDLSVSEIAGRAGMPLSTTHRLLGELVALGLLERLPGSRYCVGIRLWELAVRTPGALGIREIAMPHLVRAHSVMGQNLQLGILQDREMLYLIRLSAPVHVVNFIVVGGRIPFHATSSGLLLAAYAEPEVQERLVTLPLEPYQHAPLPTERELRSTFRQIRSRGHLTTRGYVHPDATSIAVPVRNPLGRVVAAINAIVPTDDPHEASVLQVLIPTSKAITEAMARSYRGEA